MSKLHEIVSGYLGRIYPNENSQLLASRSIKEMGLTETTPPCPYFINKWSEKDAWLITYGDSVHAENEHPLKTLNRFASKYLSDSMSGIHILPFFPYSSDGGFSVIDYSQVNDNLGDWSDIELLSKNFDVMADLVVNHCSQRSRWFENFKQRKDPGKDYFYEALPNDDVSKVVRPRTSELLRETQTLDGVKYVWCTFSHDQVDLNYKNPDLFIEMLRIIRRYLEQGIRIFRLDAVAFLWKDIGTDCLHRPETHEFIKLFRTLIEAHTKDAIVITETNVPTHENLSYFGNSNEAHAVYNFSLPPLLIHALLTGTSEHLKRWQMSMPPAQTGTFYFNFIASHDGIGLRPVKGLLCDDELDELINTLQSFGARVSWRSVSNGKNEPYEVNVALFDALQGTVNGPDKFQIARFICAHAIMFSLEGVPGLYIHSLLGTQNDYDYLELTNHNRNINRHKWEFKDIERSLETNSSHHSKVYQALTGLLKIRSKQSAFHPNAVQYTLHLGDSIFAFWRQSVKRDQSIFCIHNVSDQSMDIPKSSVNLIDLDEWSDLISGKVYTQDVTTIHLAPYQFVWLTNQVFDVTC